MAGNGGAAVVVVVVIDGGESERSTKLTGHNSCQVVVWEDTKFEEDDGACRVVETED